MVKYPREMQLAMKCHELMLRWSRRASSCRRQAGVGTGFGNLIRRRRVPRRRLNLIPCPPAAPSGLPDAAVLIAVATGESASAISDLREIAIRHPRRMWQVLTVFLDTEAAPARINRAKAEDGTPAAGPLRMRLALDELGGAWVKLGQMLAMRFDPCRRRTATRCSSLNQVRPYPYAQVREIVARDSRPAEDVFGSFETARSRPRR
jgi:hypothetical protein